MALYLEAIFYHSLEEVESKNYAGSKTLPASDVIESIKEKETLWPEVP
jgi:hypothetical protein